MFSQSKNRISKVLNLMQENFWTFLFLDSYLKELLIIFKNDVTKIDDY